MTERAAGTRIEQQLHFVRELDRLKAVLRQTSAAGGARRENSAEHSWHLALMATVLREHAPAEIDTQRAIWMLLVHDVVEIDAGDAFCYDEQAMLGKEAREQLAAERIFGLLPADQAVELQGLWEEFEAGETAEARYANALDRLQPLLQNLQNGGGTWKEHGVTHSRVLERMRPIEMGAPALWSFVLQSLQEALERGWVREG